MWIRLFALLVLGSFGTPLVGAQSGGAWSLLELPDEVVSVSASVDDTLVAYRPAEAGGFARSTDGGQTWSDASAGLPRDLRDPSRPASGRLERTLTLPDARKVV